MEKYKSRVGRHKIVYSHTGEFDAWVPATMEFLGTLMPPTLSKRAAAMLLLVAGMGNEEIVALTGMCIRSVRALRKTMEEQEPTSELFEYYEAIAKVVGYTGNFIHNTDKPEGMKRKLTDVACLSAFGWQAKTSLDEGLSKTFDFYLQANR
ncbi:hypothetical protein [Selenomonas sp. KH1T6]|uniref:hypothetical protein n=1 Tax=Selenomonas sp. KH1T6 TaxID=3158784 RepID=UPI0008A7C2D8|nr:hypothetical protein SAMN05216583_1291 [Selenomonas ruminantium]